jgi:hypothetical protein
VFSNYKPLTISKSREENGKDKQLHDMAQKYSSGEIFHEQYICNLGFKYQK